MLGAAAHAGVLVARGLATDRLPWGNMYEFATAVVLVAVVELDFAPLNPGGFDLGGRVERAAGGHEERHILADVERADVLGAQYELLTGESRGDDRRHGLPRGSRVVRRGAGAVGAGAALRPGAVGAGASTAGGVGKAAGGPSCGTSTVDDGGAGSGAGATGCAGDR